MLRSKLGLKALGLCAIVLGTMAFASVAQAETNAYWLVNGAKFTTLKPTVEAQTDVEGVLLTELGGKFIHIKCATISVNGHLSGTTVLGNAVFHGCKFFELVTPKGLTNELTACQPRVGANLGLIETKAITGLIKLHSGFGVVEARPTSGTTFATINLGELCAFGENITIGGVFFLYDVNGNFKTNATSHLVAELPALTALTVNGGAKTATTDGSATVKLGGAHTNMTFSGQPG